MAIGDFGNVIHALDLFRGLRGALRRDFDRAGDFLRRGALLGDGGGDGAGDIADFADRAFDRARRLDRALGRRLHGGDLRGDFVRRFGGLPRKRLHFTRDDSKAATGFARARRLDRGVERQKIGLRRDVVDQSDDVADATSGLVELLHGHVGLRCFRDRLHRDAVRLRNLPLDLVHRGRQFLRGRGDVAHVAGGFGRSGRRTRHQIGGRGHAFGDVLRALPHVARQGEQFGQARFHVGAEARNFLRHHFLSFRARFGIEAHGLGELAITHHRLLENGDRSGQCADLVLAVAMRDRDVVSGRDLFGDAGDIGERLDTAAPDHEHADAREHDREYAEYGHPVGRAGDALLHLRIKLL